MCKKVVKIYNNDNFYEINKINPILKRVISPVQNKTALDIGCGTGMNSSFMLENGYSVTGIDINREAMKAANKRGVSTIIQDIRYFEWNKNYDLITLFYMLQHMQVEDAEEVLNKAIEHLEDNGLVIIAIFIERKNAITPTNLISLFENNNLYIILEKYWDRIDSEHGTPHVHKGYYCVLKKRRKQ